MNAQTKYTPGIACRHCGRLYAAPEWQIRKRDFECVPCRREAQLAYRARRKAEGRPVHSGRMSRKYHQAYESAYTARPEVKERRAAQMRSYSKGPLRPHHEARWLVRRAIEAGRLQKQPCEICGATNVHAHHDDYSKPLDVHWLCRAHHVATHAKATGAQG